MTFTEGRSVLNCECPGVLLRLRGTGESLQRDYGLAEEGDVIGLPSSKRPLG